MTDQHRKLIKPVQKEIALLCVQTEVTQISLLICVQSDISLTCSLQLSLNPEKTRN